MLTRRAFLHVSGATSSVLAFSGVLPGLRCVAEAATPPLRRSLGEMDLDDPDLVTLRDFVRIMQDPSRNAQVVSWIGFANVHGTATNGFNKCPHGNWYFLPWHRAYLQMYEAAARSLTGRQEFALPYWDWTADRQLPRAFAEDTFDGQPNPLFVPDRWMSQTDSLQDSIVGQAIVMDDIYAETNFEAFGSSRGRNAQGIAQNSLDETWIRTRGDSAPLEATPHDNIHCIVGGPFMCSAASAQDPLFLMHHGNLDRVWAVWNSLGRLNTVNSLWTGMRFTDHFIGPNGANYTRRVDEVLEVEPLGYTYGLTPATPIADIPNRSVVLASLFSDPGLLKQLGVERNVATTQRKAEPLTPLDVALSPGQALLRLAVQPTVPSVNPGLIIEGQWAVADAENVVTRDFRPPQVYAVIRNIDPAAAEKTQLRVFVNCDYLSQATPTSDPHFVTTIGFFGADAHAGHGSHTMSALVNLTPALARLERGNRLDANQIRVQLLPAPQYGRSLEEAAPVSVSEVEVIIA